MNVDEELMKKTLDLAEENLGLTYPNPSVGCIITDKNHNILAHGVTSVGGRPHGEVNAFQNLTFIDPSNIIYVSLEPCAHYGVTPPCLDKVISSGIKNIVIAAQDPDSRVNGKSLEKLKSMGLNVKTGVLEQEAIFLNAGFFMSRIMSRPLITLKIATSLDGKVACDNGHSKWISNEKSRQYSHKIRSHSDAILTTSKTVFADDPLLNVRYNINPSRKQPARIILDRKFSLNEDCQNFKIFQTSNVYHTIVFVSDKISIEKYNHVKLKFPLLEIFCVQEKDELFDLNEVFKKLASFGFTRVLIESGGRFATNLLKENLIDQIFWFHAPIILGNDAKPSFFDLKIEDVNLAPRFKLKSIETFDDDIMKNLVNMTNLSKIGFKD